jgi:hypothetical protein
MSAQDLKDARVQLYGGHGWQTRAAVALGVDASTIRRWTGGQITVPGPVEAAVNCFMREAARKPETP